MTPEDKQRVADAWHKAMDNQPEGFCYYDFDAVDPEATALNNGMPTTGREYIEAQLVSDTFYKELERSFAVPEREPVMVLPSDPPREKKSRMDIYLAGVSEEPIMSRANLSEGGARGITLMQQMDEFKRGSRDLIVYIARHAAENGQTIQQFRDNHERIREEAARRGMDPIEYIERFETQDQTAGQEVKGQSSGSAPKRRPGAQPPRGPGC